MVDLRLASLAGLLLFLVACSGSSSPDPGPCQPTVTCATATCGTADGCGGTCGQGGLPCLAAVGPSVQGGLTLGAGRLTGPAHQVQGALVPAAPGQPMRGTGHVVEQGTLR